MEIWTALAIGFLGSFHCIGMCGPLAMALPGKEASGFSLVAGRVLYNFGRIVTYSIFGAVFGLVGHSIALAGFQKSLSILLGALIVISVLIRSRYVAAVKDRLGINSVLNRLKNIISAQFRRRKMNTLFTIGVLNGLLPCGFVYVGLAGSLTTGSVWYGLLYMTLFGLGTFPAMFAISLAPGFISLPVRQKINRFIPVLAILLGLFLIYRGIVMGSGHQM